MNKLMKRKLLVASTSLACVLGTSLAGAAEQLLSDIAISGILSNPQGGFLLILNASNPACGPSGNQFNVWTGTTPGAMSAEGAKGALSIALTAFAMGKPIKVYFNPAISGCPVSQVWIAP